MLLAWLRGQFIQNGRAATSKSTYTGSAGNDTFMMLNQGDIIAAGEGAIDNLNVDFTGILGGIAIDLSATDQVTSVDGATNSAVQSGFESVDVAGYTNFGASITGSSVANAIIGTASVDSISPGAGVDTITGGAGADVITLAGGVDTMIRNGDGSTDGIDNVTGFVVGSGGDVIDFTTNGALMAGAATTGFDANVTLDDATGFAAHGAAVSQGAAATIAQATAGFTVGTFDAAGGSADLIYIAYDDGTDTYVAELVSDAGDDGFTGDSFTVIMKLVGVADALTLTADNFADFS